MKCQARCWNANGAPNEGHVCAWDGTFKGALRANPPQKSSITAAHQDWHALKAIREVVCHLVQGINWHFSTSTWGRALNNRIFCLRGRDEASSLCNRFFFFFSIGLLSGTEALKSRVLLSGLFLLLVLAPFQTKETQKIEMVHFIFYY